MSAAPLHLQGNRACALGGGRRGMPLLRRLSDHPVLRNRRDDVARAAAGRRRVHPDGRRDGARSRPWIGASLGGVKAMTATSGPGFSLMQEHLGYAAMTEVPCVIVDVMRGGPSTGMPTRPAQGDLMQARWGTHGDHPIVGARACFGAGNLFRDDPRVQSRRAGCARRSSCCTTRSFAHLIESVEASPAVNRLSVAERKWASGRRKRISVPSPRPMTSSPPMARPGDGLARPRHRPDPHRRRLPHSTAVAGGQGGRRRLIDKIERHRERGRALRGAWMTEDAEVRHRRGRHRRARGAPRRRRPARRRDQGGPPPADHPVAVPRARHARGGGARAPSAGGGDERRPTGARVERLAGAPGKVARLNRIDGEPIAPAEIVAKIRELAANG